MASQDPINNDGRLLLTEQVIAQEQFLTTALPLEIKLYQSLHQDELYRMARSQLLFAKS